MVRTTGDWYPNFDGDMVECRLYEIDPPVLSARPTRAERDHYDRYRGRSRWRITVWGADDTGAEAWFDVGNDAITTFEALVSGPCPGIFTLCSAWGFSRQ